MQLFDHTTLNWAILQLSAFVIGISKAGMPGAAVMAIPLAALVLPAKSSTGVILPLLIAGDLFAVVAYRRDARWRHLLRLLPSGFAGILVGYGLLGVVTDSQLRPIIGGLIIAMLILAEWRERAGGDRNIPSRWWFAVAIGMVAGIATMMANAAGPFMAIYLLAAGLPRQEYVGTGAWYYFMVNWFKVPFSWDLGLITPASLVLNATLLPTTVAGAVVGFYGLRFVSERYFVMLVKVLTLVAAVKLLL